LMYVITNYLNKSPVLEKLQEIGYLGAYERNKVNMPPRCLRDKYT